MLRTPNIPVKDSLQSNDAARAGDRNSNLLRDGETREACANCHAEIVDGHWFCRLPGKEAPTLLCCPSCALRYFDRSHSEANGSGHELNSDEHRFHFFVNGGQLWS
jgi:hypothetical protein